MPFRYEGGDIGPTFLEARVQHRRWIGCEKHFLLPWAENHVGVRFELCDRFLPNVSNAQSFAI
jgi:hypothetical protein